MTLLQYVLLESLLLWQIVFYACVHFPSSEGMLMKNETKYAVSARFNHLPTWNTNRKPIHPFDTVSDLSVAAVLFYNKKKKGYSL